MFVEVPVHGPGEPDAATTMTAAGRRNLSLQACAYLSPALLAFAVWVFRPLAEVVRYSFYDWNLNPASPMQWVGWSNYSRLVRLPQFWQSVATTGFYLAVMVACGVVVPVVVATVTHALGSRARTAYRALIFLPVLVSPIVAATIWSFLLTPTGGAVNELLSLVHVQQINWLLDASTAPYAVVLIAGWKVVGISALVAAAGLASVSTDYLDAARVDRAGPWRIFREITMPLLSPTLVFLFVTTVLLSSQFLFPLINTLTQGGPNNATSDAYYFLYTFGFTSFNVGLASAAALLVLAGFGVIAVACVILLDRFAFFEE